MASIIAPNRKPKEFGFKAKDCHLVVNAATKTTKAYRFDGTLLWEIPCLADGQHPNWRNTGGDTPPGLYKLGKLYNDIDRVGFNPAYDRIFLSYGWICFDMIDLEGNEDQSGRAGIAAHGGGKGCGWPGAWKPLQDLYPTHGCVRYYNQHLKNLILPLYLKGTVFISVWQDNA